jgi:uncharacterized protein (TIGR03083 family)
MSRRIDKPVGVCGVRLDHSVPVPVLAAFHKVNDALPELLRGFTPEDWKLPTVHRDRSVKDLTAHLLQTSLARVSGARDGYRSPTPSTAGGSDLIAMIQRRNSEFMTAMRWVSPQVLIELLEVYDRAMMEVFEKLDPDGVGIGVAWAGEAVSRNWFDIAREYTEKWHHQQQLRDATGRPPLYQDSLLEPVLETFARGLPFAFRSCAAQDGAAVELTVTGPVTLQWTLRRAQGEWSLWSGADPDAQSRVAMPADVAWRVWTTGLSPKEARGRMEIRGNEAMATPIADFVAIMAARRSDA